MTRYQDDFYDAINGEWQKTADIPADKSQTGGFIDLDQEIEDLMLATTDKWLEGEEVPEDAILANFVSTIVWSEILISERQMELSQSFLC